MIKPTKWHIRLAKTRISLGICPVWSKSSLFAWRKLGSLASHWVQSEDWSDWADAQADLSLRWAHVILLVLSWSGSNLFKAVNIYLKAEVWCRMFYEPLTRKPVFGVSDQVRLKPACTAKETSYRLEISVIASRDIILSRWWITKVLIRLCRCTGWSASFLFAYDINRFSHDMAHMTLEMLYLDMEISMKNRRILAVIFCGNPAWLILSLFLGTKPQCSRLICTLHSSGSIQAVSDVL